MMRTTTSVTAASRWSASDVGDPSAWTYVLDEREACAIVSATAHARLVGAGVETLTVHDFALPELSAAFAGWNSALANGRGFVLVRGFPVDQLSEADIGLAYFGLGLHLGTPVSQDALGTRLGHVRDRREPRTGPEVRLYATNQRQDFHTDGADIIGLLCLNPAKVGGESRIASAAAIYDEIQRRVRR